MAWETPKTDWTSMYDESGLFIGDFFNVGDYNRIKNNLVIIRDLATQVMGNVPETPVGVDKHYPINGSPDFNNDNFFADEINLIEDGLAALDNAMPFVDFGQKKTYYDNGRFIDYQELNRIESAEAQLYELLTNSTSQKARLAFRLGSGIF